MMGPKHNPGVNIRSIEELFRVMEEKEKTNFKMKVSKAYNSHELNCIIYYRYQWWKYTMNVYMIC